MKKTFKLIDLDCANCAAKMEAAIKKLDGVNDASVSFLSQKMTIDAEDDKFDEIVKQAQQKATEIVTQAQQKSKEIRQASQEFSDDVLRKAEESLVNSLTDVRQTRQALKGAQRQFAQAAQQAQQNQRSQQD